MSRLRGGEAPVPESQQHQIRVSSSVTPEKRKENQGVILFPVFRQQRLLRQVDLLWPS